jgi:hypothetical protein
MASLMRYQLTSASAAQSTTRPQRSYHIVRATWSFVGRKEQPSVFPDFFYEQPGHGKNEQSLIYNRLKLLICYPVNVKQNRSRTASQKFLSDTSEILIFFSGWSY